jgi:chromate transporter
MFDGLKPAVVAIVILALLKISKKSLQSNLHYIIAALSYIAIFFFNISFILIIFSAIISGILFLNIPALKKINSNIKTKKSTEENSDDEAGYYLTTQSEIPGTGFYATRLFKQLGVFVTLWSVPLLFFYSWSTDFVFWKNLSLFFTQSAVVTFGGAYAVLPYVAQQAVETYGWLSSLQMIDGLALGETTPGPLIMVLAFVGFIGAYHQFDNVILAGTIGLITTTYYTFLPSFLFILAGAPLIEKTQQNTSVKAILGFVTAAVTGVVLNLTIYFAEAVLFKENFTSFSEVTFKNFDYISLCWILVSFFAMHKFKIDMLKWIVVSALFGLVVYFLS